MTGLAAIAVAGGVGECATPVVSHHGVCACPCGGDQICKMQDVSPFPYFPPSPLRNRATSSLRLGVVSRVDGSPQLKAMIPPRAEDRFRIS